MYRLAREILTAEGYEHYEISNYARSGYQCRHNRVYWENRPYYGFGMGAASYVEGRRLTRPRKTQEYYQWVRSISSVTDESTSKLEGETQPDIQPAIEQNFQVSENDVLLETLMLGLRLTEGVSLSALISKFSQQTVDRIWRCLQPYWRLRWVEILTEDGVIAALDESAKLPLSGNLRLSDPEGFLFSNTILADLFSKLGEDN